MSLLDFLIWPTNETYLVLSTDYYNNAKLPLRMNNGWDMMEEVYDYDTGGHSAGQEWTSFFLISETYTVSMNRIHSH